MSAAPALASRPDGPSHEAPRRKLRLWRWPRMVTVAVCSLLLVVAGTGAVIYRQLTENIASFALHDGLSPIPTDVLDAEGRAPTDILVLGSDTRSNKENCDLGGNCTGSDSAGANADVIMLVRVAPDRSHATVMSIPRDLVVTLPSCRTRPGTVREPRTTKITNSLQAAPSCTVAAVEQLTGVAIDHFMVVDFSAVITMSNAIGGVDICVDGRVYDPFSGLKLSAGTHTLVGQSALELLRTRHGFGNASDLGRQQAQKTFLASMLRKLSASGTLANPSTVLRLADAATSSVTVDSDLAGLGSLVALGNSLRTVPPSAVAFVSLPTQPDPDEPSAVVLSPESGAVLDQLRRDVAFTAPAPEVLPPSPQDPVVAEPAPGVLPAGTTPQSVRGPVAAQPSAPITSDGDLGCLPVAQGPTTDFGTPAEAYDANPDVPDSAP